MTFDLGVLTAIAVGYLLLLFLIAYVTDRRWLPTWLTRNPFVYVLSLGVYATTWSYYGSVGFAQYQGLNFLTIYLGVTLAFVLTPVLLMPILRLTRTYQLTSVADLFAFRFNSQPVGVLVTLLMLAGVLPYIALQIRAVAESTQVLTRESSPDVLAFWFVVLVTVFTIIFGARHVSPREHHDGLVAAIAFESLMKLVALLLVAGVAMYMAFGGPVGMQQWLAAHPEQVEALYAPAREGPWASLLVLAFAAAFLLPRQFHMLFAENQAPGHLNVASWAFPLFLLLLTLAVPPILWAAQVLEPGTPGDYHVLGIPLMSGWPSLALLAYLGGISAASAMIVVSTLAISSMTLNHLVLPLAGPQPHRDFYGALRWARRVAMVAVIAAGYGFYRILEPTSGLVGWGLISFLAMAQLLPGIVGLLFWPRATSHGFIAGLLGGASVWVFTVLLPPVTGDSTLAWLGLTAAGDGPAEAYQSSTFWSLSLNALLFVTVSLLSRPDEQEREAAAACRDLNPSLPVGDLQARSPKQFVKRLATVMGKDAARKEVDKAVRELGLSWDERRPNHLHGLRAQIERNISGMMGPVLARMIVDERLQLDKESRTALAQNVRLIEDRLETSRTRLRGLAAELDRLRRYHRQIIEDLPLGVCAVAQGGRLVRWNPAIAELTGIPMSDVIGRRLDELPGPWGMLLASFLESDANHWHRQEIHTDDRARWYSLHKATIEDPGLTSRSDDTVLLVEDLTEVSLLEQELAHSERLASIGRLAAGVAHEIGNPVTGISCLAQELRDEDTDREREQAIAEEVLHQAQRINNIVQSLVRYAHGGADSQQPPEPVRLRETVDEATRLTTLSRRARFVRFDNDLPETLTVTGNPQQLVQVFVNLFSNAADACADHADEGIIRVTSVDRGDGWLTVQVRDNGEGIPADVLDQVLEPFVTTKQPGHGTGLGLPLVYNIVREHGGEVLIDSDHEGTCITLRFRPGEPHAAAADTVREQAG
ncbi:ATP-binding protein [Aquisalimonas lutea]|uniref:sensor histidine kinase n=1 Tax=Aquisalimonas lutea TaxID=1327750 RepID=UPI0025B2DE79|nr:sensor histidine kinase [Aquisalimonas lutea]MDN3518000.1 ATP-binding protein [Aquisalimonas lutea]